MVDKKNPVSPLLTEEQLETLRSFGLINEANLRNIGIKRRFLELRKSGLRPKEAIKKIKEEGCCLSYNTINKIAYTVWIPEELKP